jgi:hypothetical protein
MKERDTHTTTTTTTTINNKERQDTLWLSLFSHLPPSLLPHFAPSVLHFDLMDPMPMVASRKAKKQGPNHHRKEGHKGIMIDF